MTRSFVLIDLKVGEIVHQDLGQMQMYVNYYQREMMAEGENPRIGIVLCADKSDAVVRYTLPEGNKRIFASRYKLYLLSEDELKKELLREKQEIEMQRDWANKCILSNQFTLAASVKRLDGQVLSLITHH